MAVTVIRHHSIPREHGSTITQVVTHFRDGGNFRANVQSYNVGKDGRTVILLDESWFTEADAVAEYEKLISGERTL